MKKLSLIIFLITISHNVFSQMKMRILFKDGSEKIDDYKYKGNELLSVSDKKKYHIDDIRELYYYTKEDTLHYYVIDTKKYITSKNSNKRFAQKKFNGKNIELYYVHFNWTTLHPNSTVSFNNYYDEAFVKRKDEEYAYNMGYIYGAAQKGIKKRVEAYFTDCPELIDRVKRNEIERKDTMEIVRYYDEYCIK